MTQATETAEAEAKPAPKRHNRSCRKWVVLLAVVLLLLLGWGAKNYFTSSAFLRPLVVRGLEKEINGEAELDAIVVRSPRDVRLHGLALRRMGAEEPDISAGRIQIAFNPWAFLAGKAEPAGASVSQADVRVKFDEDGRVNLADLFDLPREPRRPRDPEDLAGLLAEGVRFEQLALHLAHPGLFKDHEMRTVSGLRGVWQRGSTGLDWMHFSGEVLDAPFRGVQFDGWTRLGEQRQFRMHLTGESVQIGPELAAFLPADLHEAVAPFHFNGWANVLSAVELQRGRAPEFTVKMDIAGASLLIPPQNIPVTSASAKLAVVPGTAHFVLESGFLFDGLLDGASTVRFYGNGQTPILASLNFQHMNLALLLNHLMPGEDAPPGMMSGNLSVAGNLATPKQLLVRGEVALRDAVLVELPLFASLFSVLNLNISRSETVRSGDMRYWLDLDKGRFHIRRAEIRSRNVQLSGKGSIGFDGTLDITVVTALTEATDRGIFGSLRRITHVLVDGVQRMVTPPIHVTGTLEKPKFEVMAVRHFGRPITSLFDLVGRVTGVSEAEEKE